MFDKCSEKYAIRYGILDRMEALERDLMKLSGIVHVEYDIRDYGDPGLWKYPQIILILKYDLPASSETYFEDKRRQIENICGVCLFHDLHYSGDRIEDMGAHWYIVRSCGKTWPRIKPN